nr:hypothetical protein GZ17F1_27 [uncultured archaeon GZfos17F1]
MGDNVWAHLSAVGNCLRRLDPGFDPRSYGCKQLYLLVKAHSDLFELKNINMNNGTDVFYIKIKY